MPVRARGADALGSGGRAARLEGGHDIRTIQTLMGRKDVRTTMACTHVLYRGPQGVRSPLAAVVEVQGLEAAAEDGPRERGERPTGLDGGERSIVV